MPSRSINIQPNRVTAKLAVQVSQDLKESFPVATFRLNHSCTAQKRSDPAGNIQSFLMLAGCRNLQSLPDERPAPAKPGMQGESAFILENNGFFRPQCFEFFLAPLRISSHLRLLPGGTRDWPVSNDTRVDASSAAPDEPSTLRQSDAVNALPPLVHPNGLDSNRTSGVILPGGVPTGLQSSGSFGSGVPAASSGSELRPHPYSPPESSGLRSSGSGPEPQISSLAVVLRGPGARWRSLCLSRLPVLSRPGPKASLLMPFENPKGRYSCPQYNRMAVIM